MGRELKKYQSFQSVSAYFNPNERKLKSLNLRMNVFISPPVSTYCTFQASKCIDGNNHELRPLTERGAPCSVSGPLDGTRVQAAGLGPLVPEHNDAPSEPGGAL